ncbi:MAG: hypothetical protein ABEK03_03735 [Candidatus Bipolaricaulia bacterium]
MQTFPASGIFPPVILLATTLRPTADGFSAHCTTGNIFPPIVSHTFRSSRSYHPSYSLLGRAVRTWVGDRLRGEALFIVVLTGLALALLMGHYLGWALLKSLFANRPSWQLWFWGGQVISVLLLAGFGLVGFRPAVRVTCTSDAVELRQGSRSQTIPYPSVDTVDTISTVRFHRHYRRYAATQVFVSGLSGDVICLDTEEGPVIVSFSDSSTQAALLDRLQAEQSPIHPSMAPAEL